MCPICWISGLIALMFGVGTASLGIEWYYVVPAVAMMIFGVYKMWDGWKRGKHMTDDTKTKNKKTLYRFIQGVLMGAFLTGTIFFVLAEKEHMKMHKLLEENKIEHTHE